MKRENKYQSIIINRLIMSINITLILNDKERQNINFTGETTVRNIKYFILLNIRFIKIPILYKCYNKTGCLSKTNKLLNEYNRIQEYNNEYISSIRLIDLLSSIELPDDFSLTELIKNKTLQNRKYNNILVIVNSKCSYFKEVYNRFFNQNRVIPEKDNNINNDVRFISTKYYYTSHYSDSEILYDENGIDNDD